jgi:hypothetical protein
VATAEAAATVATPAVAALEVPLAAVLRPTLYPGQFTVAGAQGRATVLLYRPDANAAPPPPPTNGAAAAAPPRPYQPVGTLPSAAVLPSVGDSLELWAAATGRHGNAEQSAKVHVLAVRGADGDVTRLVVAGEVPAAWTRAGAALLGAPFVAPLWVPDAACASGYALGSLACPGGLFPAPVPPGVGSRDRTLLRRQFRFLGRLFGKV